MRTHALLLILAFLVASCGRPVDRLVKRLSSEKDFELGISVYADLPTWAKPDEMASNAIHRTYLIPPITNLPTIEVREVGISGETYTAVLVNSDRGKKIVLYRLEHGFHNEGSDDKPSIREHDNWWVKVYDAK